MKICPRCGSEDVIWILPNDESLWICKECDYTGHVIEGTEEIIKETSENYIKKLEEEKEEDDEDNEINQGDEPFAENLMKICPRCGSDNIDWIIPQNWSLWDCKTCSYRGPAIEGTEEIIKEIREDYIEKLKKNTVINKTNQENELSDNFMKICPKCGSNNIDWFIYDDNSHWFCNSCSYLGFAIEGNEELAKKIKENYELNQENELFEEKDLTDEEIEKKLDELIETDFIPNSHEKLAEKLINEIDDNIIEIYKKLSEEILSWNEKIKFKPINNYLTFSYYHEFLKVGLDNDKINLQLSFNENKPFDDYKYITKEIASDDEDDGITKVSFSIYRDYEIEYALFLIKQSYENNSNDSLLERFINKYY